jgi:tetratricopeptide (TPR) repeat protein
MVQRKLKKEVEGYIKRIGQLRSQGKFGRAVQFCDRALEVNDDALLRNVLLQFKGDSLYRVGRRVKDDSIIDEARACYQTVLDSNPEDAVAKNGLNRIDRMF